MFLAVIALLCVPARASPEGIVQINVRESPYNAVGDGVHDDHGAISMALGDITKTGGTVYLPPGAYYVSAPLVLSWATGVTIRGAGPVPASDPPTIATRIVMATSALQITSCSHVDVMDLLFTSTNHLPGVAVETRNSFWVTLRNIRFESIYTALLVNASNTVSLLDGLIMDVYGPAAIDIGAPAGGRTDIVHLTRVTANIVSAGNTDVTWVHIGQGANTVRMQSVGLVNGGHGIRMDTNFPTLNAVYPYAIPLFLFADDLEIDFPKLDAVALAAGRVCNLINSYIQGSQTGSGILIGAQWTAEVQVTNTRISGHARAGIAVYGGYDALLSNNIVADNSQAGVGTASAIELYNGTSTVLSGNRCGPVQTSPSGGAVARHAYGIHITGGAEYVVTGNICTGNQLGGVKDDAGAAQRVVSGNLPL